MKFSFQHTLILVAILSLGRAISAQDETASTENAAASDQNGTASTRIGTTSARNEAPNDLIHDTATMQQVCERTDSGETWFR